MLLTPRQEKFCIEYAKCGNARQAYIAAGYSHKKDETTDAAASRLLSNVKVQRRLAELAEEAKNAAIADIQEMQEVLTQIIRQNMTEEVLTSDGYMVKRHPAVKDVINAINSLGRMQGAFVDKIEADVDMDLNITVTRK